MARKPGDTRKKILRKAIEVFAEKGFAQASSYEIAKRCGLTQPAAFHYFSSKEELIRSTIALVVADNHRTVSALFTREDSALRKLEKHFEGNLRWALENPDDGQILLLVYYYACVNREFGETYETLKLGARARIADHLCAGVREGVFQIHPKQVDLMAELLHDSIVGAYVNLITMIRVSSPKKLVEGALKEQTRKWQLLFPALLGQKGHTR